MMRTSDTSIRTAYMHNNNTFHNFQGNEVNSIGGEKNDIANQKNDENADIFDNFSLCQKYGQANIEKAILLLILIISITGFILYYYWKLLKLYYIKILLVAVSIDIILLFFYCYLRLKFNSNDWVNSFPTEFYNFIDYIITINFILKVVALVIFFFHKISLGSIFIFSFKFLLELYLLISCAKFMIFCPGYKSCEGFFEYCLGNIRYLCFNSNNQTFDEYRQLSDDSGDIDNTVNIIQDD